MGIPGHTHTLPFFGPIPGSTQTWILVDISASHGFFCQVALGVVSWGGVG